MNADDPGNHDRSHGLHSDESGCHADTCDDEIDAEDDDMIEKLMHVASRSDGERPSTRMSDMLTSK